MKRPIGFLLLTAAIMLAACSCIRYYGPYGEPGEAPAPPPSEPSYTESYDNYDSAYFYNELEPYGVWVSYRPYGYVWIPRNVGYAWRPYTTGHWVWTDYGWSWVSLEPWGWIPFHYGRWGFNQGLGWFWVPDTVWGPAWVAWRWGDAHVGWAPLPPGAVYMPGRGFERHQWDIPGHYWNFVRGRDFMDHRIDRWVLPAERNVTIINLTRFEVNIDERDRHVFDRGVDIDTVRRWTNRPVDQYSLKDATRPGPAREEGRSLVVTRPTIKRNDTARPKQVIDQAAAEKELSGETSGRIYRRTTTRNEEAVVREEHTQERTLMRESQDAEINEVRRRARQDEAKVQTPVEKKRIADQAATRVEELKKKHAQEKAELEKRQKAEADKAKTPIRRKVDPDRSVVEKS